MSNVTMRSQRHRIPAICWHQNDECSNFDDFGYHADLVT